MAVATLTPARALRRPRRADPRALIGVCVTLVALAVPTLVSGTVIIEGIFSWPGMGNLAFNAAINRDYPMVLGILLLVGSLTIGQASAAEATLVALLASLLVGAVLVVPSMVALFALSQRPRA